MKFSIVVPSYNQAQFLEKCLQSLVRQDAQLEILVYDGGSSDESVNIIKRYADKISYWQSCDDGGQAAALRAGFERASGDILGWLNSDDMLLDGALGILEKQFSENPEASLVYGDAVWIDTGGKPIKAKREIDFDWDIFAYGYCFIPQPSAMFTREAYVECGGVCPDFHCCMDYDLWHRLVKIGNVVHAGEIISAIRDHNDTKTNRLKKVFGQEHEILREKYIGCSPTTYKIRHLANRVRRVLKRLSQGCYRPLTAEEERLVR